MTPISDNRQYFNDNDCKVNDGELTSEERECVISSPGEVNNGRSNVRDKRELLEYNDVVIAIKEVKERSQFARDNDCKDVFCSNASAIAIPPLGFKGLHDKQTVIRLQSGDARHSLKAEQPI